MAEHVPGRLLVFTGSRNVRDRAAVRHLLAAYAAPGARLMHGANGVAVESSGAVRYRPDPPVSADALADAIWRNWMRHGVREPELFPALWTAPCRAECERGHRQVHRARTAIRT
jgi:hypothetical protein